MNVIDEFSETVSFTVNFQWPKEISIVFTTYNFIYDNTKEKYDFLTTLVANNKHLGSITISRHLKRHFTGNHCCFCHKTPCFKTAKLHTVILQRQLIYDIVYFRRMCIGSRFLFLISGVIKHEGIVNKYYDLIVNHHKPKYVGVCNRGLLKIASAMFDLANQY